MNSAVISRVDHISIAVRDHRKAVDFFRSVLGAVPGSSSMDEELKFLGAVLSLGDLSRIEIISPTEAGSFLDGFLAGRQGVHHICLQTPDIKKTASSLRERNIPFFGYDEDSRDDWKDLFIHPRDAFGILIQIAEFEPAHFIADELKLGKDEKWRIRREADAITLTLAHAGGGTISIDLTPSEAAALARDLEKVME